MTKSKASGTQKKPSAKKATAKPRVKKALVQPKSTRSPSAQAQDSAGPSEQHNDQPEFLPESSNVPVVPPSTETATRPVKIKLRYDSQKSDPDYLYPPPCPPSPKLVEISSQDDASSHGSLTPKAKTSDRFGGLETTGTIIDWRREPSVDIGEDGEPGRKLGLGDASFGQIQASKVTRGNGLDTSGYHHETREHQQEQPTAERPTVSWVLKYPSPLPSDHAPYRHEQLRKESKGKARDLDKQSGRRSDTRHLETASQISLPPVGIQSGLYDYPPITNFGYAPFPSQQNVSWSAGPGREQASINPYDHLAQPQYPYPTQVVRPTSSDYVVSPDVRSLPYYASSTVSSAPYSSTTSSQSNHFSGVPTLSGRANEYNYAGSAPQAEPHLDNSHSASTCQASNSAVSITIPAVSESDQRQGSARPTTTSQRSASRVAGSARHATEDIKSEVVDPALETKPYASSVKQEHFTDGGSQQNTQLAHQSSAHPVYAQMAPVVMTPPSISAQIEYLVFHVSPLCPLEELDFAFYLACCWNGEPTMLRSTCALYQQWISAGLQRTEDLVSYFLHSQQSVMNRVQYFRKVREGRLVFNPANRKCDNCFGTSPTLPLPTKEQNQYKHVRMCKDCGHAMSTLQQAGNYFHTYTLERRKLVVFHEVGIRETLREMGFPVEGAVVNVAE